MGSSLRHGLMRPRRATLGAMASTILMGISLLRVFILFLEAYSVVSDERNADNELLTLCRRESSASSSSKFRNACLDAHADRASPVVLKALLRAIYTAWTEFSSTVSTPFGFTTVLLFVLASFLLPVLPWLRMLLAAAGTETDDDESGRIVVLSNGTEDELPRGNLRKRVRSLLHRRSRTTTPYVTELPEDEGDGGWITHSLA